MDFSSESGTAILLVDNGSLRPESTSSLRRIAQALSRASRLPIEPVSLLHSSAIDAEAIGGRPAEILEPAIRRRFANGVRHFAVVPLFFGPSAALTEYLPERMERLSRELPGLDVQMAAPVVEPSGRDTRVAKALASRVRDTKEKLGARLPGVVMVDHGSPQRVVGEIRNRVAAQLAAELQDEVSVVVASSMERRPGIEFSFNEPLLRAALMELPRDPAAGDVVVAQMFFSPGRHAGAGGDIERICRECEREFPGLRVGITEVLGEHPMVIEILGDRVRDLSASRGVRLTQRADYRSVRSASHSG